MGLLSAILARRTDTRATIENPNVPLSSPAILTYLGFGHPSEAGIDVSPTAALKLSAVWSCLRARSEAWAALPFDVYERTAAGGRREVLTHPLRDLLRDMVRREAAQWHVDGWGNGYLLIERDRAGQVVGLKILPPDVTAARVAPSGAVYYLHWAPGLPAPAVSYSAEDVLHVAGPGWDGLSGYSVLSWHADTIGYALAVRRSGSRLMANDARPRGLIKVAGALKPGAAEGIRERFEELQNSDNFGRIGVLQQGAEYQPIGLPPDDVQYIDQAQWGLLDVCRLFAVPPHKVGHLKDAGDRANIEHENLRFATDVLVPVSRRWEVALDTRGLTPGERARGLFTKVDLRGMLRGDFKTRMEGYATARQNGLLNANEIRALEDQNPIPGRAGDVYLVPLNLTDAAEEPDPDPAPAADPLDQPDADRSLRRVALQLEPLFRDGAERLARREAEELRAIARRLAEGDDIAERLAGFWSEQARRFRATFGALVDLALSQFREHARALSGADPIPRLAPAYDLEMRSLTYSRTQAAIIGGILSDHTGDPARAAGAILRRLETWRDRAAEVAWRELGRLESAIARGAAAASGLSVGWRKAPGCTSTVCSYLADQARASGSAFLAAGDPIPGRGPAPGWIYGPPTEPGCRCALELRRGGNHGPGT